MKNKNLLLQKVAEIYNWLDLQTCGYNHGSDSCEACGRCCDFESFDHRLFVTMPELIYLKDKLGDENIRPMQTGKCPYNVDGKCTIYEHRFAGCRVFHCKADVDCQSKLSELAVKKFKSICAEFQIPYRYTNLKTALNSTDDSYYTLAAER